VAITETGTTHRILASDLQQHTGERVRVEGWIHAIRKFGAVNFLVLRDRSGMAQVVLEPEDVAPLEGLQVESVVAVEGTVEEEPRAANGVEIDMPESRSSHRSPRSSRSNSTRRF
jgi:nondiscriminating aspartyl-tRNA synthetase